MPRDSPVGERSSSCRPCVSEAHSRPSGSAAMQNGVQGSTR